MVQHNLELIHNEISDLLLEKLLNSFEVSYFREDENVESEHSGGILEELVWIENSTENEPHEHSVDVPDVEE